jgi:hypothetical protein
MDCIVAALLNDIADEHQDEGAMNFENNCAVKNACIQATENGIQD